MRVNVDRKVRMSLPNGSNQTINRKVNNLWTWNNGRDNSQGGSVGLQETSHILHTKDMDALFHELVNKLEVILQGVLLLVGACNIAAVTNDSLANTTSLLGGIDAESHLATVSAISPRLIAFLAHIF